MLAQHRWLSAYVPQNESNWEFPDTTKITETRIPHTIWAWAQSWLWSPDSPSTGYTGHKHGSRLPPIPLGLLSLSQSIHHRVLTGTKLNWQNQLPRVVTWKWKGQLSNWLYLHCKSLHTLQPRRQNISAASTNSQLLPLLRFQVSTQMEMVESHWQAITCRTDTEV